MNYARKQRLYYVNVSLLGIVIFLSYSVSMFFAGMLNVPVAYAAPVRVQVSDTNAGYCAVWKITHEPVAGATTKMMNKLCNETKV